MSYCLEITFGTFVGGYATLQRNGKTLYAHRVAFEEYWGVKLPSWLHVLHECDNPPCVNVDHLFLGTQSDNAKDMIAKGRNARGEQHGQSKLTEETATYVMARLLRGESQSSVAKAFGVSRSTILQLWRGGAWGWLFTSPDDE